MGGWRAAICSGSGAGRMSEVCPDRTDFAVEDIPQLLVVAVLPLGRRAHDRVDHVAEIVGRLADDVEEIVTGDVAQKWAGGIAIRGIGEGEDLVLVDPWGAAEADER